MNGFSVEVQQLFQRWNKQELLEELQALHAKLVERRVDYVVFGNPDTIPPEERTLATCRLLQQTLLHRSERLLTSLGEVLLVNDTYGAALIARGHCEATAVLGYFCNRLESYIAGNVDFDTIESSVAISVLGAAHRTFDQAPPPLNIMTCLQRADRYLDKHLFEQKKEALSDIYNWLSNYAHPNFLSHLTAIELDRTNHRMMLKHDREAQEMDFQIADHAVMSASFFDLLYEAFTGKLEEAF